MAIPDFHTFSHSKFKETEERKVETDNSFAKAVGWTAKVLNADGKEIDNPVTFQEVFNSGVWEYIRDTCAAGQQKLDKEAAEADDDFMDLIED